MEKNYQTSNNTKIKNLPLRKNLIILFVFFMSIVAYGQQTATITTTSNDSNWSAVYLNTGGAFFTVAGSRTGWNKSFRYWRYTNFDFSPNVGNGYHYDNDYQ